MKAGKLTTYITLQTRDSGTDAAGQPVQTWTDLAGVWADVRGANGMATIKAPVGGVEINWHSFRIRHRADINAGMRVVCGGVNYDIKQVRQDIAGKDWLDLVCEQGGNDG